MGNALCGGGYAQNPFHTYSLRPVLINLGEKKRFRNRFLHSRPYTVSNFKTNSLRSTVVRSIPPCPSLLPAAKLLVARRSCWYDSLCRAGAGCVAGAAGARFRPHRSHKNRAKATRISAAAATWRLSRRSGGVAAVGSEAHEDGRSGGGCWRRGGIGRRGLARGHERRRSAAVEWRGGE
jgi:hypothetical protein